MTKFSAILTLSIILVSAPASSAQVCWNLYNNASSASRIQVLDNNCPGSMRTVLVAAHDDTQVCSCVDRTGKADVKLRYQGNTTWTRVGYIRPDDVVRF